MERRLDKAAKRLCCLEDMKERIEKKVEQYLCEVCTINQRIEKAEDDIEHIVQEQAMKECQNRMREEICKLKQEKRNAEQKVDCVRKVLSQKMKTLEKCRKSCPII